MKTAFIAIILLSVLSVSADETVSFKGKDGVQYSGTVTHVEWDGITVSGSDGICKVPKDNLPAEIAEKFKIDALPVPQPPDYSNVGNWKLNSETDPMDDSKTIWLELDADKSTWKGEANKIPTLIFRRKASQWEGYITWPHTFIGSDTSMPDLILNNATSGFVPSGTRTEFTTLMMRWDEENVMKWLWHTGTDGEALFCPRVQDLVKLITIHRRLIVRVIPYRSSEITCSFILDGFSNAARNLGPIEKYFPPFPTPAPTAAAKYKPATRSGGDRSVSPASQQLPGLMGSALDEPPHRAY